MAPLLDIDVQGDEVRAFIRQKRKVKTEIITDKCRQFGTQIDVCTFYLHISLCFSGFLSYLIAVLTPDMVGINVLPLYILNI